ncbi:kinase-like domain-containing protein [Flammula alnicola]|nr:kinase-like domain-containing protein [Flammula alnicola]
MGGEPSLDSFLGVKRIGAGGFGVIDEGVGPNGESVAIKKELASDKVTRPNLEHEYHVYKALAGHECIPDVKAYGRQRRHNVMVMDLLGPSLGDRFRHCAHRFSLRTTARLALGMLDAIEYIHSRGFIHRDVKPENFLLGLGTKSHVVHPVDFGLARRWRHSTTGAHVSSSTAEGGSPGVIGTLPFASIHAHLGQAQTRRDDLQALAYTILLFARGSLPWGHIRGGTRKHRARRILEKKRSWTAARLCQDLPHELEAFCSYCFGLEIGEEPEYHLLRDKLAVIANREGWNADAKFEWEAPGWIAASDVPEPAAPSLKQVPPPCIKRGDVVLLKLIPEKSLDYEHPPRSLDPSFFPHQTPTGVERQSPYRPAVVRRVISEENDATYCTLEVYPLMRRSSLNGLSTRRSRCFLPLEMLIEAVTGIQVPCDDIFLYKTTLLSTFKIEYDQATTITSQLSVPECILARLENELTEVPAPYSLVYDSDDEETRTIRRRLPKTWAANNYVMEMRPCDRADLSGGFRK